MKFHLKGITLSWSPKTCESAVIDFYAGLDVMTQTISAIEGELSRESIESRTKFSHLSQTDHHRFTRQSCQSCQQQHRTASHCIVSRYCVAFVWQCLRLAMHGVPFFQCADFGRGISTCTSVPTIRTAYESVRTLDFGLSIQIPSFTQNFQACQGQITSQPSRYPEASEAPICGQESLIAKYSPSRRNTATNIPLSGNARPSPSGISSA